VYKVKRVTDGGEYALKKIKLLDLKDKEKENALNEVRLLASIRHPNIVCYKEAFFEKKINVLW
jgi:NIMA (never in mitosis gene a)-related kinase